MKKENEKNLKGHLIKISHASISFHFINIITNKIHKNIVTNK